MANVGLFFNNQRKSPVLISSFLKKKYNPLPNVVETVLEILGLSKENLSNSKVFKDPYGKILDYFSLLDLEE